MKLILVRHGETENNYNEIIQGRGINESLNDGGVRQAKKAKMELKDKQIDICYTSPMARAWQTAMICMGDRLEIFQDERITERYLGELEGVHVSNYDHDKYWDFNLNTDEYGIEPIKDVVERVNSFLEDIKEKYSDKTVIIFSHRCVINAIHNIINKNFPDNIEDVKAKNCCILEYEVN